MRTPPFQPCRPALSTRFTNYSANNGATSGVQFAGLQQSVPRRAASHVGIVDDDVGERPDDAGGPLLDVIARPLARPRLAIGPGRVGEFQPGPLHPATHSGRQPSAKRVQSTAQTRAIAVQDVHNLASMDGA